MKLKFIIPGEVISKKNSKRCFGGKAVSSAAHKKWEKQAIQEIQWQKVKWEGPPLIELHCHFFRKTRRGFDYSNMIESVQDMLVKAGVLPDDDFLHCIPVVDGATLEKNYPRVNVTIIPATKKYNHGFEKGR